MDEIDSNMTSLSHIFTLEDKVKYIIPEFQREFVWTNENIIQLFLDFEEDTDNFRKNTDTLSGYLLGNIVLIRSKTTSNSFIVVDGQQRLTTLTLIYRAINIQARLYSQAAEKQKELLTANNASGTEIEDIESEASIFSTMESNARSGYEVLNEQNFKKESLRIIHEGLNFGEIYKEILRTSNPDFTKLVTKSEENIRDV